MVLSEGEGDGNGEGSEGMKRDKTDSWLLPWDPRTPGSVTKRPVDGRMLYNSGSNGLFR